MICVKCGKEAVADTPFCPFCGRKQEEEPRHRHRRSNGEGCVFKRGNSWYAKVTLYSTSEIRDGKLVYIQKRRTKGGFKTRREAVAYTETLRSAEARRMPTLLELYTQWEQNDLPKLSADKQSAYKKARERLDSLMGRKIDALTVAEMQEVVNHEASSYYTARDIKTLLSHLYKKALPDQYVTANLSSFIVLPELNEKEAIPFNSDEVSAMWEEFARGNHFVGYMLLMIYTGMMPVELFSCRKDMIDLDKCEIWGCGRKTKKRKEVAIVFPDFLCPVIEQLMSIDSGNGRADKRKLLQMNKDNFYKAYHAALKAMGIRDLPPYSCRHTTGTEAAKIGLSVSIIQQIMRHSRITTTQRYIHLGAKETHEAVNQMPN